VRLADTVQPATLDVISRWQRWMLEWQTVAAPMSAAVETAFISSTRRIYLDSQALDFAGSW